MTRMDDKKTESLDSDLRDLLPEGILTEDEMREKLAAAVGSSTIPEVARRCGVAVGTVAMGVTGDRPVHPKIGAAAGYRKATVWVEISGAADRLTPDPDT